MESPSPLAELESKYRTFLHLPCEGTGACLAEKISMKEAAEIVPEELILELVKEVPGKSFVIELTDDEDEYIEFLCEAALH